MQLHWLKLQEWFLISLLQKVSCDPLNPNLLENDRKQQIVY